MKNPGFAEAAASTHSVAVGTNLGLALRKMRVKSGRSASFLAEAMGVPVREVTKIEQSYRVDAAALHSYVEALGAQFPVDATLDAETKVYLCVNRDQYFISSSEQRVSEPKEFILSIKPIYTEKIFSRSKTVELRRRFPLHVEKGNLAYIYATSPVCALVGVIEIDCVEKLSLRRLW